MSHSTPNRSSRHRQQGVALFVALIVMIALSLAGVALIRSVGTSTSVVGNIAFRQSSLLAANWAIEEATSALYANEVKNGGAVKIADPTADDADNNYCSTLVDYGTGVCGPLAESVKTTNPNLPPGVPAVLQKKSAFPFTKHDDGGGNEVRYVIERMCRVAGSASADNCDMMPPKEGTGTTVGDTSTPPLGTAAIYRVSVRVDGPSNSGTSFVQAWLH